MAATKSSETILASSTITAGTPTNGTELNASTMYGCLVCGKVTNGGTAPATPCVMSVYVGESTGVKRLFAQLSSDIVNSSVNDLVVEIPPSAMFINVTFSGNTSQNVTAECYAQALTGI